MSAELRLFAGVARVDRARANSEVILAEFMSALERYDWRAAEDARVRYLASVEATLDEHVALQRLMQEAQAKR